MMIVSSPRVPILVKTCQIQTGAMQKGRVRLLRQSYFDQCTQTGLFRREIIDLTDLERSIIEVDLRDSLGCRS